MASARGTIHFEDPKDIAKKGIRMRRTLEANRTARLRRPIPVAVGTRSQMNCLQSANYKVLEFCVARGSTKATTKITNNDLAETG